MLLQFEKTETHLISFLVTLPYLRIGFVGVEGENETDWFPKEAAVLENENVLGWLINVALHWSLFPVVVEFKNNIDWFTESGS